jgi:hypothetical protein
MLTRTSQHRGVSFVERWSNRTAFLVGFLTGRGYSAPQIADVLDDGTVPGTITKMWEYWSVNGVRDSDEVAIRVPLTSMQRSHLFNRAQQHGLSVEEYARRLLVCGSMPVDRYPDIVRAEQFEDVT